MRITGLMWFSLAAGLGGLQLGAIAWGVHLIRSTIRSTARHHAAILTAELTALRDIIARDGLSGLSQTMRRAVDEMDIVDAHLAACAADLSDLARQVAPRVPP